MATDTLSLLKFNAVFIICQSYENLKNICIHNITFSYIYRIIQQWVFFQTNPLDVNPTQDPKNPRLFSNRDINAIASYLGTDPVFVDSDLGKFIRTHTKEYIVLYTGLFLPLEIFAFRLLNCKQFCNILNSPMQTQLC